MGDQPGSGGPPLEPSFEELFRTGFGSLVRTLTIAAGDREVATDCVADAFERAYARWNRISRYDEPLAWVRRVAINRLRDHERRRGRGERARVRLAGEPATAPPPKEPAGFDVGDVLAQLPRQQRTAAALFYVDGLSLQEIASAMHLSAGAVKFHLHRARETLRPSLSGLVAEEER